ncbi:cation:proton antiporter [Paractinoplanes atraurantiacus]|uniref:Kef-type K+ transport system, membrane component KefB n=1 Tax=Paractinoplanes atraurantiacus TaxID=1036182 RepID=A0A285KM92_9ACTN|nr:cation:proton antiporter [Actinoplanes atraurantiacus]SNY73007.1 Kef-type K+ transport system, membrane component KefB [Actinoplanes atraurantiacus]
MSSPLPSLAPHTLLVFLLQVSLLLMVALALGRLATRFGLPALVGELLTGVILGPSLLGALVPGAFAWVLPADADQLHLVDAVGQFGVLLLVGVTGVQLDSAMLRKRGITGAKVSLAGLLLPLALGIAAGFLVPAALLTQTSDRGTFALFLGVAMCVTAIPVIAKTLSDMGLLHRDIGQLTLAAGMVDDAVGWFLLSVVSAAATTGVRAGAVTLSVVYLIGFVVAALVVGRPLVRWVLDLAGKAGDGGPRVTASVVLILLGAAATHAMGMEALFGAFIAGILIGQARAAEKPDPRPGRSIWQDLSPLRTIVLSVLAPLFMATAGLRMDLTALADPKVLLAGIALLLVAIAGKFAGAYIGARASRLSHWESIALGAGMNSRGVVEVVVATTGLRLGVLSIATYTVIVLIAVITSVMGPPILRWSMSHVEITELEQERALAFSGQGARA